MGGNKLGMDAGKVDDTALAQRPDVTVFTTEPLLEDFEFIGRPTLTLSHTTDNPFADLFVRISEVNEKGRSYNISEAYQRVSPHRETESIDLLLSRCAHRFVQGRRIRLIIAGGSHPHYARNLGVENPDNTSSGMKSVEHTIFHGVGKNSKLIFQ
jgi:putative CocE/NonD family hydrolase